MPTPTINGVQILKFGTHTLAVKIVNDSDLGQTGQKLLLDDEAGQNVTHISNFGLEGEISLSVIPLAACPAPVINEKITYNGQSGLLRSFNKVNVKRQAEVWRLVVDFIPGLTY